MSDDEPAKKKLNTDRACSRVSLGHHGRIYLLAEAHLIVSQFFDSFSSPVL
jgi:hypothetical protein